MGTAKWKPCTGPEMGSLCEASKPSPALALPEHLDVDVLTHPEAHHRLRVLTELNVHPLNPFPGSLCAGLKVPILESLGLLGDQPLIGYCGGPDLCHLFSINSDVIKRVLL